ncbi:MAG: stalk domain-containing protein [Pseudomonadota bacterium]
MFRIVSAIGAAACAVAVGLAGPLNASASAEAPASVIAAPEAADAIEYTTVIVEGTELQVRQRRDADGRVWIDAQPVFEHLRGTLTREGTVLTLKRFQDRATMSIDMADGKVRGNDRVLGALPDWTPREEADFWLDANGIAVLSGTAADETEEGLLRFTLDERLRPQFDLDLFVEGLPVDTTDVEPRTIGAVLLVPLRPVVEALGHTLDFDSVTNTVTVLRVQDQVRITLDVSTGLVSINDRPRGISPNMGYAEAADLLLPFTAIETLTGAHVVLEPGSTRIDVTLDDRLAGGALPGAFVEEITEDESLVVERLGYELSSDSPATAELDARFGGFHTRTRYETVGGFDAAEHYQPRWMSVDLQSEKGWKVRLGDDVTRFRETAGVGGARLRGVTWNAQNKETGALTAIAAGVPVVGAEQITDTASKPVFGGFVAGVRRLSADGKTEYGLAARLDDDNDETRIVASGVKRFSPEDDEARVRSAYVSGNIGAFDRAGGSAVDVTAQAGARYRASERVNLAATLDYEGPEFNTIAAREIAESEDDTTETTIITRSAGDSRTAGSLSANWSAGRRIGSVQSLTAGTRINGTKQGDQTSRSLNGGVRARIGENPLDVSLDLDTTTVENRVDSETSRSAVVRAFKSFDWVDIRANATHRQNAAGSTTTALTTFGFRNYRRVLGDKGAFVSAAPSASVFWSERGASGRLGARVAANSGQALGDRLTLAAQAVAAQSVDPENMQTSFFAGVSGAYTLSRRVQLSSGFSTDFSGANNFTFGLRGSMEFNEPRRYRDPDDGRGVLNGRVFYDLNRDGIRQENEPGIAGIGVKLIGTRLGLRVSNEGYFTIQNVRTGLYDLSVDTRTLPLGFVVPNSAFMRATVADGRITTVDVPIIASGQVRGAIFDDANGNGDVDPGEYRYEGAKLSLVPADDPDADPVLQHSAAFGQYAFENLSPGLYTLTIESEGHSKDVEIEITDDNLFRVEPIPLTASEPETAPLQQDEPVTEFAA